MKLVGQTPLVDITLPDDMLWTNEFNWSPLTSTASFSLAGSLIIEQGFKLAGRPLTLAPPSLEMAWVTRQTVQALRDAAAQPAHILSLVFEYPDDTRTFQVIFAPDDEPVAAHPVKGFPEHSPEAWFQVTLKFLEV